MIEYLFVRFIYSIDQATQNIENITLVRHVPKYLGQTYY